MEKLEYNVGQLDQQIREQANVDVVSPSIGIDSSSTVPPATDTTSADNNNIISQNNELPPLPPFAPQLELLVREHR